MSMTIRLPAKSSYMYIDFFLNIKIDQFYIIGLINKEFNIYNNSK